MKNNIFGWCLFTLLMICLFCGLGTYVAMSLWNWLIPLFWKTAPILTFWQTLGLMVLMRIILAPIKIKYNKDE